MFALPATSRLSALGFFEFRLPTLAAYGGSLILLHYAELLAEKVYNDLCSREGITFGEPMSAMSLVFVLGALFLPTLLARSRALIVANLAASLITAGGAVLLLFTASHTPYECFTMGVGLMRITRRDLENSRCGVPSFCSYRSRCFSLICRRGRSRTWRLAPNSQRAPSTPQGVTPCKVVQRECLLRGQRTNPLPREEAARTAGS